MAAAMEQRSFEVQEGIWSAVTLQAACAVRCDVR